MFTGGSDTGCGVVYVCSTASSLCQCTLMKRLLSTASVLCMARLASSGEANWISAPSGLLLYATWDRGSVLLRSLWSWTSTHRRLLWVTVPGGWRWCQTCWSARLVCWCCWVQEESDGWPVWCLLKSRAHSCESRGGWVCWSLVCGAKKKTCTLRSNVSNETEWKIKQIDTLFVCTQATEERTF